MIDFLSKYTFPNEAIYNVVADPQCKITCTAEVEVVKAESQDPVGVCQCPSDDFIERVD